VTESGIVVTDLVKPKGHGVALGQEVSVHYRAKLQTGVEFDSSYDQGAPIAFSAALVKASRYLPKAGSKCDRWAARGDRSTDARLW